ncbi:MAG: hypothetical protein JOY51_07505 [Nevskia sp.]|nr:hypothetical protein [Nevskia sp.]
MAKQLKNRKVTFVLPAQVVTEIRQAVDLGLADSASSLVREALEARLRLLREEQLRREFAAAARDPDFLADIDESMAAFRHIDAETARRLPE